MLIGIFLTLLGCFLLLAIGGWLLRQLRQQQTQIISRITELEQPSPRSLPRPPSFDWRETQHTGYPVPTLLNDFAVANLAGGTTTLSQWRGRHVIAIFVQPHCPASAQVLQTLCDRNATNDVGSPQTPIPLVIATGSPEWLASYLRGCVPPAQIALQRSVEVARLYRVGETPAAYRVNPQGVTESPLLRGAPAIITALDRDRSDPNIDTPAEPDFSATTPLALSVQKPLVPLPQGAPFPTETVPEDLRTWLTTNEPPEERRMVVLVDATCAACQDLQFDLDQPSHHVPARFVDVSSSRSEQERPSEGIAPIIYDPGRATGAAVGTLVTPSAFLLDRTGLLAAPVAVGRDATIGLLAGSSRQAAASLRPTPPMTPLVSTILITRDRPNFLQFAVSSFGRQTYANRELIVVDDGDRFPVDPAFIAGVGGRLVRVETGMTIGAKLNAGLEVARGDLCQKMDDDDWYAPHYIETMVKRFQDDQRDGCRPALAFVTPFLFFDVARWEIRRSRDRNVPGATLFFRRADWALNPFRPLPGDEDLWFFLDQTESRAVPLPVDQLEIFLAVRHRGSRDERGHTWVTQIDTRPLEDYLLERPLHDRSPEQMLPTWALSFYRKLRRDLLATQDSPTPGISAR